METIESIKKLVSLLEKHNNNEKTKQEYYDKLWKYRNFIWQLRIEEMPTMIFRIFPVLWKENRFRRFFYRKGIESFLQGLIDSVEANEKNPFTIWEDMHKYGRLSFKLVRKNLDKLMNTYKDPHEKNTLIFIFPEYLKYRRFSKRLRTLFKKDARARNLVSGLSLYYQKLYAPYLPKRK